MSKIIYEASSLIKVKNLSLRIGSTTILKNISFTIGTKEIVSLVGESGSGKSITALTLMGLHPENAKIKAQQLQFDGHNIGGLSSRKWEKIRGKSIGMVFQEPQSCLNPSMKCGKQLQEILNQHTSLTVDAQKKTIDGILKEVQLFDANRILSSYPHQLSGGQKQRIMIAMALICKPKLLIADEPTTALDITVQKEIIQLLKSLQKKYAMSILFISHDLALVKQLANKVWVMYQGEIVEEGSAQTLFKKPKHPYTKGLLFARPKTNVRLERLPTLVDYKTGKFIAKEVSNISRQKQHKKLYKKTPLLEVKGLEKTYEKGNWLRNKQEFKALHSLDFSLYPGETLGLVGESGCGKSTLAKALIYLDPPTQGSVYYQGKPILQTTNTFRKLRKEIQFVFQDPYAALHPLKTIGSAIAEVLYVHDISTTPKAQKERSQQLLSQVGLVSDFYNRYPHELSGGQRQRAVIARALATEPKLLICDESVSALDISVQAQVLNLLNDLKKKLGLSYLFISHDLGVVKYMSDRIMVMEKGHLLELQEADTLYAAPKHPYTQKLIDAITVLE
ncbi:MAG: peptide/nickel transport system ATP-binding protein [Flavobacteriaceae bacterium]|mgnify:CR=1 FL=1|jgi:peptide/nickel transport system ATP-binding protein|tara:strand:- start:4017 stop:5702 length:1686 start_codon:yes stop_codon:yes gene_type:complete